MALILKDRVQETSTTTGTGTLTLAGAVTQFQTFSSAIGNGNTTYYAIYNAGGTAWEVGVGTVGAGTLSRDTVYASSNAGSLVSFTGTLYVFCNYGATKSVYLDASGNVATPGTITANGVLLTGNLGTVTSVTGTAPVVSSGGTTPAISMAAANGTTNGYLTSTDWTTFNGKGSGTVTSVSGTTGRVTSTGGTTPVIDLTSGIVSAGTTGSATLVPVVTVDTYGRVTAITTAANPQGTVTSVSATVPSFLSISGSPITSSGTLALTYSGTALPIANGGTNSTATPTAGGIGYGTGTAHAFTGAGTSGQVLTSNGASAPTWSAPASGAMTLISTQTASSSSSLQWTGLGTTYNIYILIIDRLVASANQIVYIQWGYGGTPTWLTSNYSDIYFGGSNVGGFVVGAFNSSDSGVSITGGSSYTNRSNNIGLSGSYTIYNVFTDSSNNKRVIGNSSFNDATNGGVLFQIEGSDSNGQQGTALRIFPSTGNFVSGTASLYGISS